MIRVDWLDKATAPIQESRLEELERAVRGGLPPSYRALLQVSDGAIVGGWKLYSSAELLERNATYRIQEFMPGYLLVGDNGGGRGLFLRTESPLDFRTFVVGFGALSDEEARAVAPSFEEWLELVAFADPDDEPTTGDSKRAVDIFLLTLPRVLSDLVRIRSGLGVMVPLPVLLTARSGARPRLLRAVPLSAITAEIRRLGLDPECFGVSEVDSSDISPLFASQ